MSALLRNSVMGLLPQLYPPSKSKDNEAGENVWPASLIHHTSWGGVTPTNLGEHGDLIPTGP